ncbi:MAG: hypothetical protein RML15_08885 [Bacteroidota bacterium]|nr:hypothetical protein [Candidatus Kapabacteria bacterium]MCS7302755.1 hypothetical protein [Candidatus Kapabacteria bacterium]MCX7937228.1 hypothetical protein [Chlorobiota bacterium]MDW8075759.1 hypothetical protein [Bacteroidota bacterium]MDW8272506.1 hypothetical protein [Bacteroidota bacterium]
MRIAVPSRPIFDRLVASTRGEHQIIRAPQAECEMLLRTARAELACISPLGIGTASALSDYRIVGTTCLVGEEHLALASVRFRAGLEIPQTYYAPEPQDFITTVGLLLLAEQHELVLEQVSSAALADTIIGWNDMGEFPEHPVVIDLTEEWWLAMECGLPLGVWVCRSELAEEHDVVALTRSIAAAQLPETEYTDSGGVLHWQWSDQVREALRTTVEMLYYHRFIEEIPALNVL